MECVGAGVYILCFRALDMGSCVGCASLFAIGNCGGKFLCADAHFLCSACLRPIGSEFVLENL